VRAPGRVNVIGEHTDYNEGFVLPVAIDRWVWIALRARADRRVVIEALDFSETVALDLEALSHAPPTWAEYIRGVAQVLGEDGHALRGFEGVLAGDVPIGAGLSSSAALELAAARAFAEVSGLPWDARRMALLAQRAENEWVGVRCGVMDPMISAGGREGHALLIDCRSLESRPVPIPGGVTVVVLDTSTRRGLVDSAYNERRRQCEQAAQAFGVRALRDVGLDRLQAEGRQRLDETSLRRARHVVSENARTLAAAAALEQGDLEALGRAMDGSHASLRDDFEVSSEALDAIVAAARRAPGCIGARMTGAGFGGCAVAAVHSADVAAFTAAVSAAHERATGRAAVVYPCRAVDGAEVVGASTSFA
jgi:galactokinase